MSSSGINTLTTGTINGLNSLALDELTTTTMSAGTIDGDIIYYNRIEGNEIIVDTKLTLTSTGVISVGNKFISDIELTYLDGVSSNIQTQINNINTNNSALVTTVNLHSIQITALQAKDVIHTNKIGILEDEVTDLYASDDVLFANLAVLSDKTMFQTRNSTATIFSNQVNVPNGNIGFYNSLLPNNFYIQSNLGSGNNIVLNSGSANIYLQSQNVYLGKSDATTGRKSNLHFYNIDGNAYEIQSSAFTESLKTLLIDSVYINMQQDTRLTNLEQSDGIQNTNILALQEKTQNITSANTTSTNMNKPLYITSVDALRLYGNHGYISGWSNGTNTRDWVIGTESPNVKKLLILNEKLEGIYLKTGSRTGNANLGQNKIVTHSNGISLKRGGITSGDTEVTVGEIGATNTTDSNFYINGNSTNNIYMSSGLGNITLNTLNGIYLNSNALWVGSGTANANGRYSNINMLTADGQNWETQSSAFTETLKSQIVTNTSKTQNITTANTTATYMNKKINISLNGEALRTNGNHTYWAGYDTANTSRHFAIGKESPASNRLVINNYTSGENVIQSGSRTGNTNLGQNKIITYSNGFQLKRGGITLNDNLISVGEIGGTNSSNSDFHILGNSTNNIYMSSGIGNINLNTNTLYVGSGTVAANGKYSNLLMLDAGGQNWETQSSAFTEALKTQITTTSNKFSDSSSFGGSNIGKISFTQAYWWLQLPLNTTSINNFSTSIGSATRSVGEYFNAFGYSDYFNATGTYIYPTPSNFNLTLEMEFNTKTLTAFKELKSKIAIFSGITIIAETQYQGYTYNNYNSNHYSIFYKVGPFKHIISSGQTILVFTQFNFQTGSDGTTLTMNGKFTIERNPL